METQKTGAVARFPCNLCGQSFTDRRNRNRHKRNRHPEESEIEKWRKSHIRCLEEDCEFAADTTDKLSKHLTEKHGIQMTEVEKEFESFEGILQRFIYYPLIHQGGPIFIRYLKHQNVNHYFLLIKFLA